MAIGSQGNPRIAPNSPPAQTQAAQRSARYIAAQQQHSESCSSWRSGVPCFADVLSMSVKEGASSLRMQLARNSDPLGGRAIIGKLLKEMVELIVNSFCS